MKRLFKNKKGTAEVIGSVMFIVILLFFFTNVYLWHDAATKEMNDAQLAKMNSGMTMIPTEVPGVFNVTDSGGLDIDLSRIWITQESVGGSHLYGNLDQVHIAAGNTIKVSFVPTILNSDGTVQINWDVANSQLTVHYALPTNHQPVRLKIINTLGITTSYLYS